MASADSDADAELRDGPPTDLHSLRARDAELDALSAEVQRTAAMRAAADFLTTDDMDALRKADQKPVLVTGSAGYLGAALFLTLQELGVPVLGLDIVSGPTVDRVGSVADGSAMQQCGQTCGAVLHTAALHAPHASCWHARDFVATNIVGTENALALGLPMVHTSTTSLTITARVKHREKAGELVWIDDLSQRPDRSAEGDASDAPRNKYGATKLAAEQRCIAAAGAGAAVCVLRASRFFPEDTIEDAGHVSLPNTKVNELLGRRCALVDLISAHLRALARLPALRGAVLTLAAPLPAGLASLIASSSDATPQTRISPRSAAQHIRTAYPHAEELFAARGWQLPDGITRVYDSAAAMRALGWTPRVTFESVVQAMQDGPAAEHQRVVLSELVRGAF